MTPARPAQRDSWLARLCAEHYGREAGLAPLVAFSGTRQVLFAQEGARLWGLVDDQARPSALALLVLDATGQEMTLRLHAAPGGDHDSLRHLIAALADKAALRVSAEDAEMEAFFRRCGMTRWLTLDDGRRVGLGSRHPARRASDLAAPLDFDTPALLRRFKHDRRFFEAESRCFVTALAAYPQGD